VTVPAVVIVCDDDGDDPVKAIAELIDHGAWQHTGGVWIGTPAPIGPLSNAERQRRHRQSRRGVVTSRYEKSNDKESETSGDSPTTGPFGALVVGVPGEPGESNALSNAFRNADRNADRNAKAGGLPAAGSFAVGPLTDDERDISQGAVRAMRDQLKGKR
jgi:hypothetical protein